ncbi:class I SAM-dependent methyltransferase [bacterium]|nr:class I SAM-dependent methyltransferase [bacterium]
MKYIKSKKYDIEIINSKIMGPNPIKLQEELLSNCDLPSGSTVMDLGSGQGVTSVYLAKEHNFRVFAADLWSDPTENMRFFEEMGLNSNQIIPIKADANELPFAKEFFDAVICTDSYNFFGRDKDYLGSKLLPFVKKGGYLYISVPGMKLDCHDSIPDVLLLSWTPGQLDYIHDIPYWKNILSYTEGIDILSIEEMESNDEAWEDWLKSDNEYAINDRKTMLAGGGKYLNFISIILRKL